MNKRLDALGHVGYGLIAISMTLIAYDISIGWLVQLLGASVWAFIGWRIKATSIYIWEVVVFLPIAVLGWMRS